MAQERLDRLKSVSNSLDQFSAPVKKSVVGPEWFPGRESCATFPMSII